jgi:hypothetical protein
MIFDCRRGRRQACGPAGAPTRREIKANPALGASLDQSSHPLALFLAALLDGT